MQELFLNNSNLSLNSLAKFRNVFFGNKSPACLDVPSTIAIKFGKGFLQDVEYMMGFTSKAKIVKSFFLPSNNHKFFRIAVR